MQQTKSTGVFKGMNFSQQQLIELFGEGCEGIFSSPSCLFFSDRCSQLIKAVRDYQGFVRYLCRSRLTLKNRNKLLKTFDKYQEICKQLFAYTGLTLKEALKSDFMNIKHALCALRNDLDELFKKFGYEYVKFGKVSKKDLASLKEYTKISESLSKTEDIKVFEEKMLDLVKKSSNEGFGPMVFVCSSSGTGKTNIALSLNYPFLYFQYYTKPHQPIDRCFNEQSNHFMKLITQDLKRYYETPNMDESITSDRGYPFSNDSLTVKKIRKSAVKFNSVGFLVELIRMVKIQYDASPHRTNPAKLQVSIRKIGYKAMTVDEGSLALEEYFNGEDYFFPLIFDRCCIQMQDWPSEYTAGCEDVIAREFIFLRSIVRGLLCMPIFVGTNPMAANFLWVSSTMKSFGAEDSSVCCLVWHRPPGVLSNILKDKFAKIRDFVNEWRQRKQYLFPSDRLLNFLEKYLSTERPLFLAATEAFVEYFCNNESSFCENDEEFLGLLTEDIMERFLLSDDALERKNVGQLFYVSAYMWDKNIVDTQNAADRPDVCVQDHFCDLAADPDDPLFPKYTVVATQVKNGKFEYKRIYRENIIREFCISTRYKPFSVAPLTGLIVTGVSADNQRILCRKMRKDEHVDSDSRKRKNLNIARTSVISTVVENRKITGFGIWAAFLTSLILASRGGGFKGCSFSFFLEHLAREYQFGGKYGDGVRPPSIKFHEDFPTLIKEKQVPFLASMGHSDWDNTFARELEDLFGAYLGTVNLSMKKKIQDMVVLEYPTNSIVFTSVVQHAAPLDVDFLRDNVIGQFKKYPMCNLFLAVAKRCADFSSFYERGAFLWVLERKEDVLHLVPAKTKIPQKMRAAKHIILLDMHCLSHANPKTADKLIDEHYY